MSKQKPKYFGILCYKEDQYDEIRSLSVKGDDLPVTYADWLEKTTQHIEDARAIGMTVVKVQIDLPTFRAWCLASGHDVDKTGRMAYGNHVLMQEVDRLGK